MKKNTLIFLLPIICLATQFASSQKNENPDTSPGALDKKISIHVNNKTIEEVLPLLEYNNGFGFSYVDKEIPLKKKVSVNSQNEKISSVLDIIFKNTRIDYIGYKQHIILIKKDDIEFLEKENNGTKLFYLPSVTEYNSETRTRGVLVNLLELLYLIRKFYDDKNRNYPYKTKSIDSIEQGSIADLNKKKLLRKKKRKKLKFKKITFKNPDIKYGISSGLSRVLWDLKTKNNQRDFNKDSNSNYSFSVGGDIYLETKSTLLSFGIRHSQLKKSGIHTDYFVNRFYSDSLVTTSYQYQYNEQLSYIDFPVKVGFIINHYKINYIIQPGFKLHYLFRSDTSNNYRIYQDQYFSNPNVYARGNPDSSPFTDQNSNIIIPQVSELRKLNGSLTLSLKAAFKISKKWSLLLGPEFSYTLLSVYPENAPIVQNKMQAGISISLSPLFSYLSRL